VRRDWRNRVCLLITDEDHYAGLALLKPENPCDYNFPAPVIKLATMKVGDGYAGAKYGELLLKAIFGVATDRRMRSLYVEVYAHHELLIQILADFGFRETHHRTSRGELVLLKEFKPNGPTSHLDNLQYHIRYGPPALRPTEHCYLVPIEPRWHDQLFPDAPSEQLLLPGIGDLTLPWGNALRKAYLCHANTNDLRPGDVLLFYRSRDIKAVAAVGLVERTLRSRDLAEVMSFVGRRTVYSPAEISAMCRRVRPLLAILFRQDRFIDPPWSRELLNDQGLLTGSPQTIGRVRKEGLTWLHERLAESP
jgi:hypothetical protein